MKILPFITLSLFTLMSVVPVALAHDNPTQDNAENESRETIEQQFQYAIPDMPGKVITSISVEYPPGASTPAHHHGDAFVIGYVLEGSIRSRVDGETNIYRVGESWTENPGASHELSENASETEPARILAIFIADAEQKELVEMEQESHQPEPEDKPSSEDDG